MSRIQKAIKATVVVHAFSITSMLLSLFTVPLYLHWLGQERYGILLTGMAFGNYLMFADGGLNWASMILIAEASGRGDHSSIAAIMRNSFSLATCSALLVTCVVGCLYAVMTSGIKIAWLPTHNQFPGLLLAIGLSVVINLSFSPFYNLLIGLQESYLSAVYQGIGRLLGIIATVAIASLNAPLGWVFSGSVAGAFVAAVLAAAHCFRLHPLAFQAGPLWEVVQIRQQLKAGLNSFTMQSGNILWGTGPILTLSSGAGAEFVPRLSIPMTLLNTPLGIVTSFGASLQAGYGEAMGRGETVWIAETVRSLLKQTLLLLGLLGCGFILLASQFIQLWTVGHVQTGRGMLVSVFIIAGLGTLMSVFRFALTGINRHRRAAFWDLLCGILTISFSLLSVIYLGYNHIGLGVILAVLLTSGWILPLELSRALNGACLWPEQGFWLRWAVITMTTAATGWLVVAKTAALSVWLGISLSGLAITLVFMVLGFWLLPREMKILQRLLPSWLYANTTAK